MNANDFNRLTANNVVAVMQAIEKKEIGFETAVGILMNRIQELYDWRALCIAQEAKPLIHKSTTLPPNPPGS